MQVSNNKEDRSDFLNGLRVRLNVDEKTLSHLEMRMTGKFTFHPILLRFACCGFMCTSLHLWQCLGAVASKGPWRGSLQHNTGWIFKLKAY
jgi:hypothetical protein